jgi:hypothetical protein
MTRDDIIRMAREAGDYLVDKRGREDFIFDCYGIERFAALVAAAEREACAEVCDEIYVHSECEDRSGIEKCADAIRARGES